MTKMLKGIGVSAALVVATLMSGQAGAMPLGGSGKAALERIGLIEQAEYTYEGKDYCWYDDGWNGPGWYVCGQYTVRGVGWGGGTGWHGWTHTSTTVVRGGHVSGGRTGGGRTGGQVSGRTGGGRTGASGRTGGGRTGGHASGRTGGGRTGGGRAGGGKGGGRR